ncbi:hydrogen gas-evolving membrane-bound hydrogenase subunit E [Anaerotignum sp.]|uniref:hydrogen gas-evolving membrane-bound hydrogenase subunit E n=1 Tax=Anaerotignum sp. TaxID=2039241 RepID=UPI003736F67B
MKEEKSFWRKLNAWINGEEALIHADEYIARREQPKKRQWLKRPNVQQLKANKGLYGFLCVLISVVFITIMLLVVSNLPTFGDPMDPANNEVMERYLEKGIEETGAINFVAGMILDYRAFDTFGESNVLFLAVICVLMLLKRDKKNISEAEDKEIAEDEMLDAADHKSILKVGAKYLSPLIILYGIYVILNGHLSPGGGFSGGSIIGAGLILYAAANGHKKMQTFFTFKTFTGISVACLLTYCGCKSYSFFTGANHVGYAIPKGTPGDILSAGFILPLNICVGLIVAATMYGFYALFTKGDI